MHEYMGGGGGGGGRAGGACIGYDHNKLDYYCVQDVLLKACWIVSFFCCCYQVILSLRYCRSGSM